MFNAYLTSNFFLQKNVFYFFPPLLPNGIQISYSLSLSSLDTLIPPQCPYMSQFLSKSPNAKFNATSAGGMQLTAVDVCSPIARLLLNYYYFYLRFGRPLLLFSGMSMSTSSILLTTCSSFILLTWPYTTSVKFLYFLDANTL